MATFMCTHKLPPKAMDIQQIRDLSRMAQQDPVVKGRRSYGNLSEGNIVCVLDAPTKTDVANFFERNHVPVENIMQVEFEGDGTSVNAV